MSMEEVKLLRVRTGAGVLDCKKALQLSDGDRSKALEWLKKKGLARAEKKSLRQAKEGRVASYLHGEGRIGVLVEVNVETDFAARGEDFSTFIDGLCLHIAAENPLFVRREDVPAEVREKEKDLFRAQAKNEGKQESLLDKIAEGRVNKWLAQVCLMEQTFLVSAQGEEPQTVQSALSDLVARLGENVLIRRFARFELGEELPTADPQTS